jgi:hypothetical protein
MRCTTEIHHQDADGTKSYMMPDAVVDGEELGHLAVEIVGCN